VYLDIGTNIGVQIRKLFEPSRYPEAEVLPIFDKHFGHMRNKSRDLCAIGIEMNPSHTSRLRRLEHHYVSKCGYNVRMFVETAASTYDGLIEFVSDCDWRHEEWGATTMIESKKSSRMAKKKQNVQALDIARFINSELIPHASKIVVKLDIEGAEHSVLPRLIMSGALCNIDEIFIEVHNSMFTEQQKQVVDMAMSLYPEFTSTAGCKVKFSLLDDETYIRDVGSSINTC
jgi:FkbM family methyltransferase